MTIEYLNLPILNFTAGSTIDPESLTKIILKLLLWFNELVDSEIADVAASVTY